ncbi:MAG: 30S ribosomal protein S20 [Candidatus Rokuibacteriota bacterium]|nr:MAG: 30S ribosomal protein S20 [Candidatus Rokubacteria bacterium]
MANTRSAIKRMKQSEQRRQRNRAARSTIRSSVKTARTALAGKSSDSRAAVQEAIRTLDRAVTRGVMHRNTAARKKSALARKLNTLA